jgi:heptosyltransferase-2
MEKIGLVIRAPNWIGDTIYCLPVWERLSERYELHIVGKGWLADLLKGYPEWRTYKLPSGFWHRVKQYQRIKQKLHGAGHSRINALVFPSSLGSAAEMGLAGLKVLGHRHEGRSIFLKQALQMPPRLSSVYQRYWGLGNAVLEQVSSAPDQISFRIDPDVAQSMTKVFTSEQLIPQSYIVVCPFAGGNFEGMNKKWPHFRLWAQMMIDRGFRLVCCPSPSEEEEWRKEYSNIHAINGLSLSQYAVILKNAKCVVSNDTGPGHLAAATGVPLISVFNQTIKEMYGAIGSQVSVVQSMPNWPTAHEVERHVLQRLQELDSSVGSSANSDK